MSVAAVMSMALSAQSQDLGLSPSELRRELVGHRESSMDVIVARAITQIVHDVFLPLARVSGLPD